LLAALSICLANARCCSIICSAKSNYGVQDLFGVARCAGRGGVGGLPHRLQQLGAPLTPLLAQVLEVLLGAAGQLGELILGTGHCVAPPGRRHSKTFIMVRRSRFTQTLTGFDSPGYRRLGMTTTTELVVGLGVDVGDVAVLLEQLESASRSCERHRELRALFEVHKLDWSWG
jgi:hypothetical protein